MNCKICNSEVDLIFEKKVLQKYHTGYYRCTHCDFVQTDNPIWLEEAYQSAITALDIGLIQRNVTLVKPIKNIIDSYFPESKRYLDYAGGYGVFVRLMRDNGYDFYRQDDYCQNIFTPHFDITDTKNHQFDLVTGFEVLEHFNDPMNEIAKVFSYADTAIFSTEIAPISNAEMEKWWYLTVETGQHIAFYSTKSMLYIAEKLNKNYYCRDGNIHIFTSKNISNFNGKTPKSVLQKLFSKKVKKESLTPKDYQYIKDLLNKTS